MHGLHTPVANSSVHAKDEWWGYAKRGTRFRTKHQLHVGLNVYLDSYDLPVVSKRGGDKRMETLDERGGLLTLGNKVLVQLKV